MKKIQIKNSLLKWNKAQKIIPCGTMTMSKSPKYYVMGASPIYLKKGKGSHVWDVDGNEYIDYILALGPVVLGYCYPAVDRAVIKQLKDGITFSLMHPCEIELAEKLRRLIPSAESVRFLKTGSEAASAAIRIARGYTNRSIVAACGYHGWHDWYIGTTVRNLGVPKEVQSLTKTFKYNDIDSLKKLFKKYPNKIAAVIMEPVGIEAPRNSFLQQVRNITHKYGAVLIFDEIITGFRLNLGGAQAYFNVTPDLSCFGKAIANGFPLAAVVGRKKIMNTLEKAFVSSTFGGEAVSIKAALATLDEIEKKDVCGYILKKGEELKRSFNNIAKELNLDVEMVGLPHKTACIFRDREGKPSQLLKSLFLQEVMAQGVIIGNGQFISYSHTQADLEKTVSACRNALKTLKFAQEKNKVAQLLRGKVSEEVFRKP
ncbi:MAG: aminotransferase class III-fold pyridoxal phosphate-dependent enzyme [Candidatus Omnitrophota bacterium]|jgi:glutamate-1-semialdehyde 2,1-aminomutase/spore coat polysaccharide biosynthesis protein SpsF